MSSSSGLLEDLQFLNLSNQSDMNISENDQQLRQILLSLNAA